MPAFCALGIHKCGYRHRCGAEDEDVETGITAGLTAGMHTHNNGDMAEDIYRNFAARYARIRPPNPGRDEFFRKLFADNDVSSVLDCSCGTGRDILLFNSFGCDVYGSDLSESMLEESREKIKSAGIDIPLTQSDFRNLPEHLDRKFDAVVCLSNSINEVFEESEAVRALESMRQVLRDGGILVVDQGQSDASMKNPPRFAPVVNTRDFSMLFLMEYFGDQMEFTIFDFIHTEDEVDFHKHSMRIAIRLQDDWIRMFEKAGFRSVDFYGGWDFERYDKDTSKRLIAVGRGV